MSIFTQALFLKISIFLAVFAVTVVSLNMIRTTALFQKTLHWRYESSETYQLEALFVPDLNRKIPLLVAGDSKFIKEFKKKQSPPLETKYIYIDGVDADDFIKISKTIRKRERLSNTKICTVLFQASPSLVLWSKTLGKKNRAKPVVEKITYTNVFNVSEAGKFFELLEDWASLKRIDDFSKLRSGRIKRHVGQARFSAHDFGNWIPFSAEMNKLQANIVYILESKGTDWGHGNLVVEATNQLKKAAEENQNITFYKSLKDEQINFHGCAPQR
jgi:hypothetical protein